MVREDVDGAGTSQARQGNDGPAVVVRARTIFHAKKVIAVCLFCLLFLLADCTRAKEERVIADCFARFVTALQGGDFDRVEALVHPSSPFFEARKHRDSRQAHWKVLKLRLGIAGGRIETLGTRREKIDRFLRCRLHPEAKGSAPMAFEVEFRPDGDEWKILVPAKGLDLVPEKLWTLPEKRIVRELPDGNILEMELFQEKAGHLTHEELLEEWQSQGKKIPAKQP